MVVMLDLQDWSLDDLDQSFDSGGTINENPINETAILGKNFIQVPDH